ncbi:MAG: TolC family protein, partial [Rhodospirillales bacterium]|nr:TolC family protein [Rhodospirillales bacterium]
MAGTALAQPSPASRQVPPPRIPAPPATPGAPKTLSEALALTYSTQPALQAERARLRATDESVPQALSGWRPTVVLAGSVGYGDGMSRSYTSTLNRYSNSQTDRDIASAQATVTQPLYTGGKTQASVNRAKNQVMAERATLINQEQTSFINTVTAYVNVIQFQQILALNINNEQVLTKQLQATNDRFRVGEITKTDVAQAEAALAGATAQRQVAEGNLQTARGTFQQVVGVLPPGDLVEPQPLP